MCHPPYHRTRYITWMNDPPLGIRYTIRLGYESHVFWVCDYPRHNVNGALFHANPFPHVWALDAIAQLHAALNLIGGLPPVPDHWAPESEDRT